jgi:peptidylprolyl isomerase
MRRGLVVAALCAVLLVVGCGSSSSSEPVSSPATTAKAEPPGPTRAKPTLSIPNGPPPKALVKKDLIVGTGAEAKTGDEVSIQYVGALYATGSGFDATSWRKGSALTFTLGDPGLTKGWNRGMTGMRVGGRRELIIPPQLAYGAKQVGPVPPHSTLVYVIDLIEVN